MNTTNSKPDGKKGGSYKDLAQRAFSAAILAAIALALTIFSQWAFATLIVIGSIILAWEWDKITSDNPGKAHFWVHVIATFAACILAAFGEISYAVACILIGCALTALIAQNTTSRAWAATGILYLGAATVLLIELRNDPDYGLLAILLIFVVVWSADITAYFFGRSLGGPKLAPKISPGKTWSGCAGGLIGPAVMVWIFASFYKMESPYTLVALSIVLALASQTGDLIESAIKRRFDVKDSGNILPGHGGLFDRVDGLIGAVLAAGFLAFCRSGTISPRALLLWG